MTNVFSLPNVLGFVGIAFNFLWPLFPKRSTMLFVQALACGFFILHFYLIGAKTGSLMVFIAGVQALAAIPLEKKPSFRFIYILTIPIILALAVITWSGLPSVFSTLALGCVSYGRYQINIRRFRLYLILANFCWIAHNLIVWSIPGLTSDILSLSMNLWMFRKKPE